MIEKLKLWKERSGNCVNMGRSIESRDKELYNWVLNETLFLGNEVKFNERVYCIFNNIKALQYNEFGKLAIYEGFEKGYSYCGRKKEKNLKKLEKDEVKLQKELKNFIEEEKQNLEDLKWARSVGSFCSKRGKTIRVHVTYWPKKRGRGTELYVAGLIENEDYIVCPITKLRKSNIRSNYYGNILGLTKQQYLDIAGHDFITACSTHKNKISDGLQVVDEETGLTKHQLAIVSAKATLSLVDEDGKSGYDKLGAKTRATHMSNVDEQGRNGYSQLATKAIIKGNKTKAEKGLIFSTIDAPKYKRYKAIVLNLTNKNKGNMTEGYITGLAGKEDAWHLDHMYSIKQGFIDGVSPVIIGSSANFKMLPWKENLNKLTNCSIGLDQLLNDANYTPEENEQEYNSILEIIEQDVENKIPLNGAYVLERYYATKIS